MLVLALLLATLRPLIGRVALTIVKAVKPVGNQGMQFVSKDKVLLEINAEDSTARDQWIIAISDILMGW